MKIQDIVFLVIFITILAFRRERLLVYLGLGLLVLAIPLFAKWIFFTAQRFVLYSAISFFTYILLALKEKDL